MAVERNRLRALPVRLLMTEQIIVESLYGYLLEFHRLITSNFAMHKSV